MRSTWNKAEWRRLHAEYLQSEEWREVQKAVIERDGRCQRCRKTYCPSEEFHCHHTSYQHWREANYLEIDDCILLCDLCHCWTHFGMTPMQRVEQNLEKYLGYV